MGFHFRKSVKFGPFRINFSKSGVGFSTGVKGARISTGPRGTFIHLGSNGFYYRKKISDTHSASFVENSAKEKSKTSSSGTHNPSSFIDFTSSDLIIDINNRITEASSAGNISTLSFLLTLFAFVVSALIFSLTVETMPFETSFLLCSIPLVIAFISVVIGRQEIKKIKQQEQVERVTEINYNLDKLGQENWEVLLKAFKLLSEAKMKWKVVEKINSDYESSISALSLVKRHPTEIFLATPPYIKPNIGSYCLSPFGNDNFYFLPDQILNFTSRIYLTCPYNNLDVAFREVRFFEKEICPTDAEVVNQIWQHQRKDGGPDLRYRVNKRIPQVKYGEILLFFNRTSSITILVSNSAAASQFVRVLADYVSSIKNPGKRIYFKEPYSDNFTNREQKNNAEPRKGRSPYEILNISPNATFEEVRTAYREQIQKYHPDKVANLGPELIRLAEEQTREINEAFEKLKRLYR